MKKICRKDYVARIDEIGTSKVFNLTLKTHETNYSKRHSQIGIHSLLQRKFRKELYPILTCNFAAFLEWQPAKAAMHLLDIHSQKHWCRIQSLYQCMA